MVILRNPGTLVFGSGSFNQFILDFLDTNNKRLFLISIPVVAAQINAGLSKLRSGGIKIHINEEILGEPTLKDFTKLLKEARSFGADSVVGIGGGSVMDVAKLIAAQLDNSQSLEEVIGIDKLKKRSTFLACIPTTSGTGSEVSPNAIFVNEENEKVGVISKYLVPDGAYVDPLLTVGLPPSITAGTGMDAMIHCLEAYTNKFANPLVDLFALEGVRIIGKNLKKVCEDGQDIEARTQVALGSLYGGMCLGPVNTAAVHALSYPLGTDFHIPHGLSNALLLPFVMEFNLLADPVKYSKIAMALGAKQRNTEEETAREGVQIIRNLLKDCGLPSSLEEINIPYDAIKGMATEAIKIQRLLKNNIREVNLQDAENIYKAAFNKRK